MHSAAGSRNLPELERVFARNPRRLNKRDGSGWTPLHYAARRNRLFNIQYLLKRGAKLDIPCEYGRTPLMMVCDEHTGYSRIAKALIEKGANVNARETVMGYTALGLAAASGHKEIVHTLIENGANVDDQTNGGWTPLMLAIDRSDPEVAKLCLSAKTELVNDDGNSALSICAMNNQVEIAKILLRKGANVNIQAKDGWTPLMHACAENRGFEEMVHLLVQNGADLNLTTKDGWTAEEIAECFGHKEIADYLNLASSEVGKKLNENGLGSYTSVLWENEIRTLEDCKSLTPNKLKEIGIEAQPDRKKIIAVVSPQKRKSRTVFSSISSRLSFRR